MTVIILQIIAGLVGLVTLWYKEFQTPQATAKREQEAVDDKVQQGRKDLVDGNIDAVSVRLDRVLTAESRRNAGVASVQGGERPAVTSDRTGHFRISYVDPP